MAPWTPANLAVAPLFWLQADTLAEANGETPASWPDSSGRGNHATTRGAPTVLAAGLNGLKVLDCPGPTTGGGVAYAWNFLTTSNAPSGAAFVLYKHDGVNEATVPVLSRFNGHNDVDLMPFTDGNIYAGFGSTTRRGPNNSGALSDTDWHLLNMLSATDNWKVVVDGVSIMTDNTNTVAWKADGFEINIGYSNGGNNLNGKIAEVIFLGYTPTTEEEERIQGYLAWKWGLQASVLPGGHAYASAAPQTAGATFRRVNIGRMRRRFVPSSLAAPAFVTLPSIAGSATVGNTVTAVAGSVTGSPAPLTAWQWNLNGAPIGGATSSSYTIQASDEADTLTVTQTATNSQGTASATSAGAVVLAASSGAGTIETVTISNGGSGTLEAGTAIFGMLFKQGEFPSGTKLEATISGSTQEAQAAVRTTYGDGSAKHAVVGVDHGPLASGASVQATLASVSGSPASPVDLRAAMVAKPVSVRMTVTAPAGLAASEISFDASAAIIAAIDAATIDYRLRGPKATRGRVVWNPHGTNSAMRVVIDVTAWHDGHITVDANYCNDVITEVGVHHGTMTFSARVMIEGAERGSFASLDMLVGAHWLIKATTAGCPHGTIMHDDKLNVTIPVQRWIDTGLIGQVDTTLDPGNAIAIRDAQRVGLTDWELPFRSNGLLYGMPTAGSGIERSPIIEPLMLFLLSGDFRMARWVRAMAAAGNGIPWHFYDRARNHFHDSSVHKLWWTDIYNRGRSSSTDMDDPNRTGPHIAYSFARTDGIPAWQIEGAHQPDTCSVPYVLTGEDWILDQVESLASWQIPGLWDGHRGGSPDGDLEIIVNSVGGAPIADRPGYSPWEFRGVVWGLRAIQNAAEYCRNGSHTKSWATSVFNKNMTAMKNGIPAWEASQGTYKGWWGVKFDSQAPNFQFCYGSHMLLIWARRGAGGQDLKDFLLWHADNWAVGKFEHDSVMPWEDMTGINVMGCVGEVGYGYVGGYNNRLTSYEAAYNEAVARGVHFNPATGTGTNTSNPYSNRWSGNYSLLDMSVLGGMHNWFSDPQGGNNPSLAARALAAYQLFQFTVPAMPYTKQSDFERERHFGMWLPNGWNRYRNAGDPVPAAPTLVPPSSITPVPDGAPVGTVICTVGTTSGGIRTVEIRNETVPGTLVGNYLGQIRVANSAAISFADRQTFSFEARVQNDGAPGADFSPWVVLNFTITDGKPQVMAGSYSLVEHAPTATPPQTLSVGQSIGVVTITSPVALTGAPEITTQSPAGAVSLGAVTGSAPTFSVPMLVADPTDFDNEGTNPVLVSIRATNAKGVGAATQQTINLVNVVEPGDPTPLLLDPVSIPNLTPIFAVGAFRMWSSFSSAGMRVYNSGGTPADIGWDGSGDADWNAISTHAAGARASMEWRDQISGNWVTASASSRRPYITTTGGAKITAAGLSGTLPLVEFVHGQLHRLRLLNVATGGADTLILVCFVSGFAGFAARAFLLTNTTRALAEVNEDALRMLYASDTNYGPNRYGTNAFTNTPARTGNLVVASSIYASNNPELRLRVNGTQRATAALAYPIPATVDVTIGGTESTVDIDHASMKTIGFALLRPDAGATPTAIATDIATIEEGFRAKAGFSF